MEFWSYLSYPLVLHNLQLYFIDNIIRFGTCLSWTKQFCQRSWQCSVSSFSQLQSKLSRKLKSQHQFKFVCYQGTFLQDCLGLDTIKTPVLTHHWEPCQAQPCSLTCINITAQMSYNDTEKWLKNNFTWTQYILNILHGWLGGACQAMVEGIWNKDYTLHKSHDLKTPRTI